MSMISYIGATIAIASGLPTTVDETGFAAMTYNTIGEILEWGEVGDTSEDISEKPLGGRIKHANGPVDGGAIDFTFLLDGAADTGQQLAIDKSNTNDDISVEITDPDGDVVYLHGKIANVRDRSRTSSTAKGMSGQFRVNCAPVRVPA